MARPHAQNVRSRGIFMAAVVIDKLTFELHFLRSNLMSKAIPFLPILLIGLCLGAHAATKFDGRLGDLMVSGGESRSSITEVTITQPAAIDRREQEKLIFVDPEAAWPEERVGLNM